MTELVLHCDSSLSEYSKNSAIWNTVGPSCTPSFSKVKITVNENCAADVKETGLAKENTTCGVKSINDYLFSSTSPSEKIFRFRKQSVSNKTGGIHDQDHTRDFRFEKLNLTDQYDNDFFRVSWYDPNYKPEALIGQKIRLFKDDEKKIVTVTNFKKKFMGDSVHTLLPDDSAETSFDILLKRKKKGSWNSGYAFEVVDPKQKKNSLIFKKKEDIQEKSQEVVIAENRGASIQCQESRTLVLYEISSELKKETTRETSLTGLQEIFQEVPSQESQNFKFSQLDLGLAQHEYSDNWKKLMKEERDFKKIEMNPPVSVTDENLPLGKKLIIVAGHQHSFRELFFPFYEDDEFRAGLRNGTCVMAGFFKITEENILESITQVGEQSITQDGERYYVKQESETYMFDMRVVFSESYVPNRDKEKYIYLEKGSSLLYSEEKSEEGSKHYFRNINNERTNLLNGIIKSLDFFLTKSALLMRHGEAFHNLLDISKQLKKNQEALLALKSEEFMGKLIRRYSHVNFKEPESQSYQIGKVTNQRTQEGKQIFTIQPTRNPDTTVENVTIEMILPQPYPQGDLVWFKPDKESVVFELGEILKENGNIRDIKSKKKKTSHNNIELEQIKEIEIIDIKLSPMSWDKTGKGPKKLKYKIKDCIKFTDLGANLDQKNVFLKKQSVNNELDSDDTDTLTRLEGMGPMKWANSDQILNSLLTPKGVFQARRIFYQYLQNVLPNFESVFYVCSSLDRTIETLINAITGYSFINSTKSSQNLSKNSIYVEEQIQVTQGLTPSTDDPKLHEIPIRFKGTIKEVVPDSQTCRVFNDADGKIYTVPFERIIPTYLEADSNEPILDPIEELKKKMYELRCLRRLVPNNTVEINKRGRLLENKGNFPDAEASFREAIRSNLKSFKEHYNPYYDLGLLLMKQKKFEEAKNPFIKTIDLTKGSQDNFDKIVCANAYTELGFLSRLQQNFTEAKASFEEALQLVPNHPKATFLLTQIPASAAGKRTTSKTLKKRPTRRHNRRKLVSTSKKSLQKKKRTRVKNYPLKKLKSVSRKK